MQDNSDVNSDVWFSVDELAAFHLPGYPRSGRRFHDRARAEEWRYRVVPSPGRTGTRVEYSPPADVMVLIKARQLDKSLPASAPLPLKVEQQAAPYDVSSGTGALFDQQLVGWADPVVRLTLIVRGKPQFAKSPEDVLQRVSLLAFRFVFMFCDGDAKRINQWLDDADKTDGLIKLAYEADCIKRGIAPGSDLNL